MSVFERLTKRYMNTEMKIIMNVHFKRSLEIRMPEMWKIESLCVVCVDVVLSPLHVKSSFYEYIRGVFRSSRIFLTLNLMHAPCSYCSFFFFFVYMNLEARRAIWVPDEFVGKRHAERYEWNEYAKKNCLDTDDSWRSARQTSSPHSDKHFS